MEPSSSRDCQWRRCTARSAAVLPTRQLSVDNLRPLSALPALRLSASLPPTSTAGAGDDVPQSTCPPVSPAPPASSSGGAAWPTPSAFLADRCGGFGRGVAVCEEGGKAGGGSSRGRQRAPGRCYSARGCICAHFASRSCGPSWCRVAGGGAGGWWRRRGAGHGCRGGAAAHSRGDGPAAGDEDGEQHRGLSQCRVWAPGGWCAAGYRIRWQSLRTTSMARSPSSSRVQIWINRGAWYWRRGRGRWRRREGRGRRGPKVGQAARRSL